MVEKEECINGIADYRVIVSIKKGQYYCRIPELHLIAQGNDLESCYQELKKKKEYHINEIKEFKSFEGVESTEIEDELKLSSTALYSGRELQSSSSGNNLGTFLIKTGVVSLMILIVFYITTLTSHP